MIDWVKRSLTYCKAIFSYAYLMYFTVRNKIRIIGLPVRTVALWTASRLWCESFTGYQYGKDSSSRQLFWCSSAFIVKLRCRPTCLNTASWGLTILVLHICDQPTRACSTNTNNLWWQEFCRRWASHVEQFTCGTAVKWCCGDLPKTFGDILV